ncbi:MAG: HU family DNA-binding protein [Thiobacillus sp.]|jgi:DNA-binding protein HU-beta|uniref:HU family DNA-binding protein n=1 Tax=Thiobacillus sp. TaxID=924 RepID=UPI00289490FF|nr:HU family DNA-binding protein [Thiobacillus sp.]MDT3707448.1 HU family DNA-binding protein [Thiobacillus sp.]
MNKKDLVNEIAARSPSFYSAGISKVQVDAMLDTLADVARKHLVAPGAELTLPGIGKLVVVPRPARTGRNPKTGEAIELAAHNAVKFKSATVLKNAAA